MFDKMCGRKSEDGFQYFEKRKIQRPVFHKASISIVSSLSLCLFILPICEIEPSGIIRFWTFKIRHTCSVQLLQN